MPRKPNSKFSRSRLKAKIMPKSINEKSEKMNPDDVKAAKKIPNMRERKLPKHLFFMGKKKSINDSLIKIRNSNFLKSKYTLKCSSPDVCGSQRCTKLGLTSDFSLIVSFGKYFE